MDKIQVKRDTATNVLANVPDGGEPVWRTDTKQFCVGDATTSGGIVIGGVGEGVTSLNSLYDAITIVGAGEIAVTESDQIITISAFGGLVDVDSINDITGVVTISGAGITEVTENGQNIIITSTETSDVDSLNSIVGVVTIAGVAGINVSESGQVITISGYEEAYGDDTIASGDASKVVAHTLSGTPNYVFVTGQHEETSSLWVTSIDSSNFTVNVSSGVSDDRDFYWFARI